MTALLHMHGVRKAFGATQALAGVDLTVAAGEVHALIGENGAGKSTLMKVLSGAHRPDAGTVTLAGRPFAPGDPVAARRAGVAMIYQELTIAADLDVAENVLLGQWPSRAGLVRVGERDRLARAALSRLGAGDLDLRRRAGSLTNAQQQLVEIARALVGAPKVLVLDEPTSSLTTQEVERLFAVIRDLAAQGVAVVYISHFLEEVQAVCQRYTVLRDGASVGSGTVAGTPVTELISTMVGRAVTDIYPRIPHQRGAPILHLRDLAGRAKPRNASLTLHRGEILGIFGLIGAGRTEMARACFGLDPITAGRVELGGVDATGRTPGAMLHAGVGLLSENRKEEGLLLDQSIADNLTLTRLGPYAIATLIRSAAQRKAAATWVERLQIKVRDVDQPVGDLSGGNQQKVALARLLHHDCAVFILDEPTRGIDIGAKTIIYQRIGDLAAAGKAVLMISSYLPELLGVCDTIAAMCRGVLGEARPAAAWTEAGLLAAAIGQEAAA